MYPLLIVDDHCNDLLETGLPQPVAQGLYCPDCNNYFMCYNCLEGVWKKGATVEIGLPHRKLLQQCKVKHGWVFYLMGALQDA